VEVRENGIYRWDRSFKAGDTFRISVENGKVKYAHNGTVFYTSGKIPGSALRADTALYAAGSSIVNAKIATSAITWESLVNVTESGGTLRKVSGCDGCPDAGALSAERVTNGFAEFT